jgi:hypothetical protein
MYRVVNNGKHERLYYDTFAWRYHNDPTVYTEKVNLMKYNRGDDLVQVDSCFGGLAIYKRDVITDDLQYQAHDCDHPTLHAQIRANGHDNIFMNPNQITLYSATRYCGHVD